MKILLTGGTGFTGAHAVRRLSRDHELIATCREAPSADLADLADWVELDLAKPIDASARTRLPGAIDAVAHVAHSHRYRELPADGAEDVFAVNVQSTLGLLEYARGAGAQRFLITSTGGVYRRSDEPVGEEDPVAPATLYFASKYAAEVLVESYDAHFGATVLRPFFPYGQGNNLVSRFVSQVLGGEPVRIQGDPGLRINPIAVEDVADAIAAALEADDAGRFNVAGDDAVTVTELVELIASSAGVEPRVEHTDGLSQTLVGDNARMKSALGVRPRPLSEGVGSLVAAERSGGVTA
jgi:nucleoside-diphosphate-sugar epimerase